jgi:hypothetical protein
VLEQFLFTEDTGLYEKAPDSFGDRFVARTTPRTPATCPLELRGVCRQRQGWHPSFTKLLWESYQTCPSFNKKEKTPSADEVFLLDSAYI